MTEPHEELSASLITVDGIEGKMARVELPDGITEDWQLSSLPKGVREGDVIRIDVQDADVGDFHFTCAPEFSTHPGDLPEPSPPCRSSG